MTERFVGLARATLESRRMPDAPMVLMPPTEETEYSGRGTMERICDATLERFVEAMVAPPRPAAAPAKG